MAINIKEIFEGDSSNQQIDKINYNFDQILANGGGPVGLTGLQGAAGSIGSTGAQGAQGPIGPQGIAGEYTDFFVSDSATPDTTGSNSVAPTVKNDNVPSLILGDQSASSNGIISAYGDSTLKLIGSRFNGNLIRLDSDGTDNDYVDINLSITSSNKILKFDSSPQGLGAEYVFDGISLSLNENNNDYIKLAKVGSFIDVALDFNGVVNFNQETVFNNTTKLPTGASAGKVLSSSDANGTFAWTDPGVVPIGTIVMIPGFVLANSNSIDTQGNSAPFSIDNWIGRGKGDWAGWYYCNGETWVGSDVSYAVPDMRDRFALGFSYLNNNASTASKTPNLESGVKNVEQLKTVTTATNHSHDVSIGNITINEATVFNPVSVLQPQSGGQSTFTSTSAGQAVVDISPKTATLGYMIYLEKTTLKYIIGAQAPLTGNNVTFGNNG